MLTLRPLPGNHQPSRDAVHAALLNRFSEVSSANVERPYHSPGSNELLEQEIVAWAPNQVASEPVP